jgi:hypothetical protein
MDGMVYSTSRFPKKQGEAVAHESFDELHWYLRRLRYAHRQGKLVFVLGAGMNKEYGLPDWGQMLVRLTEKCGKLHMLPAPFAETGPKQFIDAVIADPLLQAAAVRGAYATSNDWLRAVHRVLDDYDKTAVEDETKPLGKVAEITAQQYQADPRRHIAILTFNYDDLMERAIERRLGKAQAKRVVVSVSNKEEMARARQRPGIYIYHLHGSLATKDGDIVLDAYSYLSILGAPGNHWSWACMNTFLFQKDSGVMFIGLSLVDPSLRLLLTQSAANGMPLSAIFVGKPLDPPVLSSCSEALKAAWMMRDVQVLFDNLLEELSLIPYHVTAWSEVGPLLDRVMEDD